MSGMNFDISRLGMFGTVKTDGWNGGNTRVTLDEDNKLVNGGLYERHNIKAILNRSQDEKDQNNKIRTAFLKALGQSLGISKEGDTLTSQIVKTIKKTLGDSVFKSGDFSVDADGNVKTGKPLTERRISAIVDKVAALSPHKKISDTQLDSINRCLGKLFVTEYETATKGMSEHFMSEIAGDVTESDNGKHVAIKVGCPALTRDQLADFRARMERVDDSKNINDATACHNYLEKVCEQLSQILPNTKIELSAYSQRSHTTFAFDELKSFVLDKLDIVGRSSIKAKEEMSKIAKAVTKFNNKEEIGDEELKALENINVYGIGTSEFSKAGTRLLVEKIVAKLVSPAVIPGEIACDLLEKLASKYPKHPEIMAKLLSMKPVDGGHISSQNFVYLLQLKNADEVNFVLDTVKTLGSVFTTNLTASILEHLDDLRSLDKESLGSPETILDVLLPEANGKWKLNEKDVPGLKYEDALRSKMEGMFSIASDSADTKPYMYNLPQISQPLLRGKCEVKDIISMVKTHKPDPNKFAKLMGVCGFLTLDKNDHDLAIQLARDVGENGHIVTYPKLTENGDFKIMTCRGMRIEQGDKTNDKTNDEKKLNVDLPINNAMDSKHAGQLLTDLTALCHGNKLQARLLAMMFTQEDLDHINLFSCIYGQDTTKMPQGLRFDITPQNDGSVKVHSQMPETHKLTISLTRTVYPDGRIEVNETKYNGPSIPEAKQA